MALFIKEMSLKDYKRQVLHIKGHKNGARERQLGDNEDGFKQAARGK